MEKKKILIIDDEEGFTRIVKLNLEATARFEVKIETKGSQGLATAKAFLPDLILLDILMPDMSGADVAAAMKEEKIVKDIPIVFLTALVTQAETEGTCSEISGYPFIAKPVKLKELVGCIDRYLA